MGPLHCLSRVSVVLLFGMLPVTSLAAQQHDAMKDKMQADTMAMHETSAVGKVTGVGDHQASGTVHLLGSRGKYRLHFTPDFSMGKGPDVYVTLTNGPTPVKDSSLVIAKLTRFAGEQAFDLPANAEPGRYSRVVLWCEKYSVALAQAELGETGKE